jgi:hypothetical protein
MGQETDVTGCWRTHMYMYQKMVQERVASAMIFEDADWDASLKHQLVQFARGSRFTLNTTQRFQDHFPKGDDLDILFIGHYRTWELPAENRRFFVSESNKSSFTQSPSGILPSHGPAVHEWGECVIQTVGG